MISVSFSLYQLYTNGCLSHIALLGGIRSKKYGVPREFLCDVNSVHMRDDIWNSLSNGSPSCTEKNLTIYVFCVVKICKDEILAVANISENKKW